MNKITFARLIFILVAFVSIGAGLGYDKGKRDADRWWQERLIRYAPPYPTPEMMKQSILNAIARENSSLAVIAGGCAAGCAGVAPIRPPKPRKPKVVIPTSVKVSILDPNAHVYMDPGISFGASRDGYITDLEIDSGGWLDEHKDRLVCFIAPHGSIWLNKEAGHTWEECARRVLEFTRSLKSPVPVTDDANPKQP